MSYLGSPILAVGPLMKLHRDDHSTVFYITNTYILKGGLPALATLEVLGRLRRCVRTDLLILLVVAIILTPTKLA